MPPRSIKVFGACEHNLKNIDVEIPRHSLTVITGLSGSGKSSLAFDTLYAEGQRRYVESLSAYARQFLDQLPKPHVERIEGLSPAISIEQKTVNRNPRSTVGTVTEIHDYLRLLYATVGHAACPHCAKRLIRTDAEEITRQAMELPPRTRLMVMAPVIRGRKGEYQALFQKSLKEGFVRAKIDGKMTELDPTLRLRKGYRHDISIVMDRLVVTPEIRDRLFEAVKLALRKAEHFVILEILPDTKGEFLADTPWKGERLFSEELGCPEHGPQVVDLAPRSFSFNSPYGACPQCSGIGSIPVVDESRVVPDPTQSLQEGAVLPWRWYFQFKTEKARKQIIDSSNYAKQLFALLDKYGIDSNAPWSTLDRQLRDMLLYGISHAPKTAPTAATDKKKKKAEVDLSDWSGVVGRIQRKIEEAEDDDEYRELTGYLRQQECPGCKGARLRPESLSVTLDGKHIADVCRLNIADCLAFFKGLTFKGSEASIAQQPLREIIDRLGFLNDVGLHYMDLDRPAATLSGGEAQRIRLATQIGSRLTGVLYILDEPSIGLHQRDNEKLLHTLHRIRDQGNTVIVVEHDEQTMREADWVVDLGPGAGSRGGYLVAAGTAAEVAANPESITGRYLRGEVMITVPEKRRQPSEKKLLIEGASLHNLKNVSLEIPVGMMIGITGVSGSGKSSLIMETLLPLLMNHCYLNSHQVVGPYRKISGLEHFDRCINVDQSPIGRTPRSNPATYTKLFDLVRDIFALTSDARTRGYEKGRFSFNVKGGRCEECGGQGSVRVEMNFLPDVYITCETCQGRRYNQETLQVKYRDKSIADVLEMTVEDALKIFEAVPLIAEKLRTLADVGLGYITLGQSALTFSGGEAQRIKLARELSKRNTGKSLYILDEPTTGLHFADVHQLLDVLNRLVDSGSTVLVIEHNLDVIKSCDWIIDLGPEGGTGGGEIVAAGPPEVIAQNPRSATGKFLAPLLTLPTKTAPSRKKTK